ncbi:hypothetical protein H257_12260 [Aphanomyces astaci]|uniref:Uncharacterized protein n=1 Tax=Aphanomyces astaci TaxID=112090 RepID=W4G0W5_APHAT|nr:hypothetical protein H257_12260 [Aphanomyces astaci]ETV72931.1 hypothetical protein H257_12260 [Aphanomyces astaci]|eukprot:XP_009837717.1 hypothetical protein H257_12260 [Aphanomyces astaci]
MAWEDDDDDMDQAWEILGFHQSSARPKGSTANRQPAKPKVARWGLVSEPLRIPSTHAHRLYTQTSQVHQLDARATATYDYYTSSYCPAVVEN